MRKIFLTVWAVMMVFIAACNSSAPETSQSEPPPASENTAASDNSPADTSLGTESDRASEPPAAEEENALAIEIIIGEQAFSAALYENETADAFLRLLPMTLDMNELNGNEKYCNLSEELPTNASRPAKIHTGDLMLYGSGCLVLFYEDFETSYSYTPIGRIDDPDGLSAALGSGNVRVTFR